MIKSYYAEFFTATILNWQKLLQDDLFKQMNATVGILANSLPKLIPVIYLYTELLIQPACCHDQILLC